MQSRERHVSMVSHHEANDLGSGLAGDSRNMPIMSVNTSLTSPTMGMSTFTRLDMLDGSMSM
jgi:hypothetical protein